MLKTIIGKLERKRFKKKKRSLKGFNFFFFPSFKLKRFTQNPKTELQRLRIGLDSGIRIHNKEL